MEGQQLVDYVRDQLAAGHSEGTLRKHLVVHGWPEHLVDQAFDNLHPAKSAKKEKTPIPGVQTLGHLRRRSKRQAWSLGTWLKSIMFLFVLVAAGVVGLRYYADHHKKLAAAKAPGYNFIQMQAVDVSNIGGAVALYAQANGVLPTSLAVAADSNLVVCGSVCDPVANEVAHLMVYKANNVKMTEYYEGVQASDNQTLYVVTHASCTGQGKTIAPGKTDRSAAILYGRGEGVSITQRCVTL
ncbi:MAG TPA: hypothetical protein VLF59_03520 [Candidatus Saccharimonadales bacterium]|nr:hypothetical protein [Candidatus Saccharimonadales bacterium]